MSNLVEQLRVMDTPYEPGSQDRIIRFRALRGKSATLYKIWVYLEGSSLPFVNKVTYILHPTFPDPERIVTRTITNQNCQLVIWAWGTFTLQAVVEDKQGKLTRLDHYLTFGEEITSAQNDPNVKFEKARYND
jgi:transcription initiation factor IIF auxiliary subunit